MSVTGLRASVAFCVLFLIEGVSAGLCAPQNQKSDNTACCPNQRATDGQDVVAVINGSRKISENEIDEAIGSQLFGLKQRIYELRKKALDNLIVQILLAEEAKKRSVTVEELKQELMPATARVPQKDVDIAYTQSLGALEGMTEDEAKQRIRLDLESRLKLDRYKSAVSELVSRARVELFLYEPVPPLAKISAEGPASGALNAPVTIVEFSDFQCPYCKQAALTLKAIMQNFGGSVRLVFKQMPLSIHPDAFKAAQASVCAAEQGKFWEYHDSLFASGELSEPALKKHASVLGLKMTEFNACLSSEASAVAVRSDMQEAMRADVQGTPTLFVNGRIVRGLKKLEDLQNLIGQALQQKLTEAKPASNR